MSAHVPAWKRLGLKLKYANEQAQVPKHSGQTHDSGSKQLERPVKRQRLENGHYDVTNRFVNDTLDHTNQEQPRQVKAKGKPLEYEAKNNAHHGKRKKSVTFTDDTKSEDGDSRITIDFPAGSPGSTPRRPSMIPRVSQNVEQDSNTSAGTDKLDEAAIDNNNNNNNNNKKDKSAKKSKAQKQQPNARDKSTPALEYLLQHRSDRSSWKFNKNRDVWVMKHALDVDKIPTSYLLALAGYVCGLPQNAGARTRLIKDCQAALSEVEAEGVRAEGNKQIFMNLIKQAQHEKADADQFIQQHSRPALLLWALGADVQEDSQRQLQTAKVRKPVKETKKRISAPVDISSSESDSDSDSDSSSSLESENTGSPQQRVAGSVGETSSSESSSDEESDSDDSSSSDSSSESD